MPEAPDEVRIEMTAEIDGSQWHPNSGGPQLKTFEERALGDVATPDERQQVIDEAMDTLSRCIPPGVDGSTAGVALGYVQSGKTLSFTALAALAADNGYQLIIVITGTKTSLRDQSAERLVHDLGISDDNRSWHHVHVEQGVDVDTDAIAAYLDEWRDPDVPPAERRTILVTVLKQHDNLVRLHNSLQHLGTNRRANVSAIIIDDEADQASLNTRVRQQNESTTYVHLRNLRNLFSRHSFLQYTATPQALLLLDVIDHLAPEFVSTLTPGAAYTGGDHFFGDNGLNLVRQIPPGDLPENGGVDAGPCPSLLDALRLYIVGVAAGMAAGEHMLPKKHRTMLIHPAFEQAWHTTYATLVAQNLAAWYDYLGLPPDDAERQELEGLLGLAYDDLAATAPDIPDRDSVLRHVRRACRLARVIEFNASGGRTPQIEWNTYALILVGGEALGRGFTVRGLTVTYMPRALGGGQTDTVQQRARFFGYKAGYLGFCRVFLENNVLEAFQEYVETERYMRELIETHQDSGEPFSALVRAFLLDPRYKLTRRNVYTRDPFRFRLRGWVVLRRAHQATDASNRSNLTLLDQVCQRLTFAEPVPSDGSDGRHDEHDGATPHQVLESILLDYEASPEEVAVVNALRLYFSWLSDEHNDHSCRIVLMSKGVARERTPVGDGTMGESINPQQGRGGGYPGDRAIKATDRVTLQLHRIKPTPSGDPSPVTDSLFLALWIPDALGRGVAVQE